MGQFGGHVPWLSVSTKMPQIDVSVMVSCRRRIDEESRWRDEA